MAKWGPFYSYLESALNAAGESTVNLTILLAQEPAEVGDLVAAGKGASTGKEELNLVANPPFGLLARPVK